MHPEKLTKVFLTTSVPDEQTAGSKARVDVSCILHGIGYQEVDLPALASVFEVLSFLSSLRKKIQKGGHIIIEYPFNQRKRAYVLYLFMRLTGVRIYALIHDVASLRLNLRDRHRELAILRLFHGLISHNGSMTRWLVDEGCRNKLVDLRLFDYRSPSPVVYSEAELSFPLKILYAGNLAFEKAAYIYDPALSSFENVALSAYGPYFDARRLTGTVVTYKGVFDPNDPVLDGPHHFGLVWEGVSLHTCDGLLGDYLRFNSPHKFSLYISLGLPIIIWEKAALARFVLDEGIGIAISNLHELQHIQSSLSRADYLVMREKLALLTPKVKRGDFLSAAVRTLAGT